MKSKIASVIAALGFMFVPAASAQDAAGTTDWREQYAYTLGVQAYIFGFTPAFFRFSNSTSTAALVDSSTQSSRRRTVKGRMTLPYSDCL